MSSTSHHPPAEDTASGEATQHLRTELDHMDDLVDTVHGDPLPQPLQQQLSAAVTGLGTLPAEPCGATG
ncbi:hypothetical protein ACFWA5_50275 [Streptomyces mirabilis]|uniref:hypothetical protein n=1 Tax=Streptomyces mirabilis TaxID=68239 RepID=UPI00365B6054